MSPEEPSLLYIPPPTPLRAGHAAARQGDAAGRQVQDPEIPARPAAPGCAPTQLAPSASMPPLPPPRAPALPLFWQDGRSRPVPQVEDQDRTPAEDVYPWARVRDSQ